MECENMQFDDTDLIFGQPTMQLPPQKPLESVTDFLEKIIQKDTISKEDLRKRWIKIKSERDRKMNQHKYLKNQLASYLSKIKNLEYDINKDTEELERLRGRMIADCLE